MCFVSCKIKRQAIGSWKNRFSQKPLFQLSWISDGAFFSFHFCLRHLIVLKRGEYYWKIQKVYLVGNSSHFWEEGLKFTSSKFFFKLAFFPKWDGYCMWLWSWLWFLFTWMNDRKYRESEEKLWQMVRQETETFFQGIFSITSSWNQLMERNWILYEDTVYPDTIILLKWLVEVLKF